MSQSINDVASMLYLESCLWQSLIQHIGVPYVFGGQSKEGLDCSGLVVEVLRDLGFNIQDMTANEFTRRYLIKVRPASPPFVEFLVNYNIQEEVYDHIAFATGEVALHATDFPSFVEHNNGVAGVMVTSLGDYYRHLQQFRRIDRRYLNGNALFGSHPALTGDPK